MADDYRSGNRFGQLSGPTIFRASDCSDTKDAPTTNNFGFSEEKYPD
jgi:hypothetical protein